MFRFCLIILLSLCIFLKGYSQAVEVKKQGAFGVSTAASYTLEGPAFIFLLDWTKKKNSFYAGPKLMVKRSYNPKKSVYGWDVGYRRKYTSGTFVNCFFTMDFQGRACKTYDLRAQYRYEDMLNPKINYLVEAFIGHSITVKVFRNFMLGNTLGVGGYLDSNYSTMRIRKTSVGRNMLVAFFLTYKY